MIGRDPCLTGVRPGSETTGQDRCFLHWFCSFHCIGDLGWSAFVFRRSRSHCRLRHGRDSSRARCSESCNDRALSTRVLIGLNERQIESLGDAPLNPCTGAPCVDAV